MITFKRMLNKRWGVCGPVDELILGDNIATNRDGESFVVTVTKLYKPFEIDGVIYTQGPIKYASSKEKTKKERKVKEVATQRAVNLAVRQELLRVSRLADSYIEWKKRRAKGSSTTCPVDRNFDCTLRSAFDQLWNAGKKSAGLGTQPEQAED